MNIEVILIAVSVLLIAWALERIFTKVQSVDRHIRGLRRRVKAIEKRIMSSASSSSESPRVKRAPIGATPANPKKTPTAAQLRTQPKQKTIKQTVCAFCGTKYDAELQKCPKCNHINIEKYRIQKSSSNAPGTDDEFNV